jgi:hypothetical protein
MIVIVWQCASSIDGSASGISLVNFEIASQVILC